MKVKNRVEINTKFNFEAPVFDAVLRIKNKATQVEELTSLDLNEMLVPNKSKIFMVKVNGESMIDEQIFDGDVLLVESSKSPKDGDIIISSLNGELTVKSFRVVEGKVYLFSANKKFLPIEIFPMFDFEIQGIVKHIIRQT